MNFRQDVRCAVKNLKAWKTVTDGFDDDTTAIVISKTRGQAISATIASARNAGWKVRWTNVHVKRAPEFDLLVEVQPERTPILREYAAMLLQVR